MAIISLEEFTRVTEELRLSELDSFSKREFLEKKEYTAGQIAMMSAALTKEDTEKSISSVMGSSHMTVVKTRIVLKRRDIADQVRCGVMSLHTAYDLAKTPRNREQGAEKKKGFISCLQLKERLAPLIKELETEGRKNMATMSPATVTILAHHFRTLLNEWCK